MGTVSPGRLAALSLAGLALFLAVRHASRPPLPLHGPEPFPYQSALPAPAPSAAGLASPPASPSSLVEQDDTLGIEGIVSRGEKEYYQSPLGETIGQPGTREQIESYLQRLAAMSPRLEVGKSGNVLLEGETVLPLKAPDKGGGILEPPTPEQPVRELESGEIAAEPDGSWSGSFATEEAGQRAIRNEDDWRRIWAHCSRSSPPIVDFRQNHVAAIFLGLRASGGYKVRILEARLTRDYLLVSWKEMPPLPGRTPPEGRTAPFTFRLVPRTELPIRFQKI